LHHAANLETYTYTNPGIQFTGWQKFAVEVYNHDTASPGVFVCDVSASKLTFCFHDSHLEIYDPSGAMISVTLVKQPNEANSITPQC
jgi:hypothetical protein